MAKPNLIERMDEIIQATSRLQSLIDYTNSDLWKEMNAELDHIDGVAGEILTMIDGR